MAAAYVPWLSFRTTAPMSRDPVVAVMSSTASKGPAHAWTEIEKVKGWECAQQVLARLSREQCGGAPLTNGNSINCKQHILYLFRCAFKASHGCKVLFRVRIPRSGDMTSVSPDLREVHHAHHMCIVEVSSEHAHVNHFGKQEGVGAHTVWKAAVAQHGGKMLDWNTRMIFEWLTENGVEGVDQCTAVRCKTWNERQRRAAAKKRVGRDVDLDTVGGIRELASTYSFEARSQEPQFCCDTAYLVPGWYVNDGDICLMFTTFNLAMNIYRADEYFGERGVVYGVDHTFKVSCSA